MDPTKGQGVCTKCSANLGKSAMIKQAFGGKSMSQTPVFKWQARFRAGGTSVDDDQHTGRLISSTTPDNISILQQLTHEDRRRTIQDLADEIRIGYGTCQQILTAQLGMHRVAAKFVPRI
jgi:hypothetical protein